MHLYSGGPKRHLNIPRRFNVPFIVSGRREGFSVTDVTGIS
jgi:hypothetical protein